MRPIRYAIAIAAAALGACTAELAPADQFSTPAHGALALSLSQLADGGDIYRLRHAVLVISGGADARFEPDPDQTSFETELAPGDYTLSLEPGFVLERERDGVAEVVEATLIGDYPIAFAITSGQTTRLALRFRVAAQTVELGHGALEVAIEVEVEVAQMPQPQPNCSGDLVINEIDYNQDGPDDLEFVELYNPTGCDLPADGLVLVFYNGGASDGVPARYAELALSAAGETIASGDYLVAGAPGVLSALPVESVAIGLGSIAIQNGDPDAVALERDGTPIDALSYGGSVAGVTEGSSAPADRGAGTLARCPNGVDSDDNATDFSLIADATPGSANACP